MLRPETVNSNNSALPNSGNEPYAKPVTSVDNTDSLSFKPFAPTRPETKKPTKSSPSKRPVTRLKVTTVTPLSEEMVKSVNRLANPPNYVPAYMKRDSSEARKGSFQLIFGEHANETNKNNHFIFNEGDASMGDTDEDSFKDTLTKMYYDHMSKVKKSTAKKLRERNKAKMLRSQPPSSPTNADKKTPEQVEKRKQLKMKQREVTDRLYQGRSGGKSNQEEDATGEGTTRRRGTRIQPKKSILVKALQKEKESMLRYLDRLITPVNGLDGARGTL
jgi:hypothetical protein